MSTPLTDAETAREIRRIVGVLSEKHGTTDKDVIWEWSVETAITAARTNERKAIVAYIHEVAIHIDEQGREGAAKTIHELADAIEHNKHR